VVLQTFQPSHFAVRHALSHDYVGFFREEIQERRELSYVPHSRLCAVRADAGDEALVRRVIEELAQVARATAPVRAGAVGVLGPAPAPVARIRGRFRYRFLLRAQQREALRTVAQAVVARIQQGVAPARAHLDVDPVSML
jgi:primosomal protein N' (replication factor Y)